MADKQVSPTPRFSRAADGTVRLIGGWPPTAVFSREVLEQADRKFLRYAVSIDIAVEGGAATYRVTERDSEAGTVTAVLVWCEGPTANLTKAERTPPLEQSEKPHG